MFDSAVDDLNQYVQSHSGWSGFFEGVLSGFVGDFDVARRIDEQHQYLVRNAVMWQNVYRVCFLASIVSGGGKIYYSFIAKEAA